MTRSGNTACTRCKPSWPDARKAITSCGRMASGRAGYKVTRSPDRSVGSMLVPLTGIVTRPRAASPLTTSSMRPAEEFSLRERGTGRLLRDEPEIDEAADESFGVVGNEMPLIVILGSELLCKSSHDRVPVAGVRDAPPDRRPGRAEGMEVAAGRVVQPDLVAGLRPDDAGVDRPPHRAPATTLSGSSRPLAAPAVSPAVASSAFQSSYTGCSSPVATSSGRNASSSLSKMVSRPEPAPIHIEVIIWWRSIRHSAREFRFRLPDSAMW